MAVQKQDGQHEHKFSNYVRIWDVVQKTCRRRWTIGKSGERGSGISVIPARHDDDDDTFPKYINPKVKVIEQLEIELAYIEAAVQNISYYAVGYLSVRTFYQ